jgi:hypothetical protein
MYIIHALYEAVLNIWIVGGQTNRTAVIRLVYICCITSEQGPGRLRLKCDGTRAETRFRLSAKRTSTFQSAGASVQSTTGSRGVRISSTSNGYTMFRGSVKSTRYPFLSPVFPYFPSRASPCAITFQLDSTIPHGFLGSIVIWEQNRREKFLIIFYQTFYMTMCFIFHY